jgi:beta-N-acetylhexosaminidase
MNLEDAVGARLMVGIPGRDVTPEIIDHLRAIHAGGVIVFRPNFSSPDGFRAWVKRLEDRLERRLLIAVDHEGGRVIHLAGGVTVFPDNLAVGEAGDEKFAAEQGRIEALELRRLGIDLNLAPTVDVLTAAFSPNIGIRSYSRDPDCAARLGAARIRAMQAGGLSACAKHFPGQGQSRLDAHLTLPVLGTTWDEMRQVHLRPFIAAIRAGVDAVMSSHPVYPDLDPSRVPATFSKRLIHDLLRVELAFGGVILSDDLEMGALREICSVEEAACRAVAAGHDIILSCHDLAAQKRIFASLLSGYRSGRLSAAALEDSVIRVRSLTEKRKARFAGGTPVPETEGTRLAREIAGRAVRSSGKPPADIGRPAVIFPRLSGLRNAIYIEERVEKESAYVGELMSAAGIRPGAVEIVGTDPSEDEVADAARTAQATGGAVVFCYDAHLFAGWRKILQELQSARLLRAVIFLRDPYDRDFIRDDVFSVQAFGFRCAQLEAAVGALASVSLRSAP